MRKILCLLICFCLLCFCGCQSKALKIIPVCKGITFIADIEFENKNYEFKVSVPEKSGMVMEINQPERLKGTVLEFGNSDITINCNGIKHKLLLDSFPSSSAIGFIHTVFSDIEKLQKNISFKNDEFYISGKVNGYEYTAYFGTTGLPIKVVDSKNNITAIFKSVTINK